MGAHAQETGQNVRGGFTNDLHRVHRKRAVDVLCSVRVFQRDVRESRSVRDCNARVGDFDK